MIKRVLLTLLLTGTVAANNQLTVFAMDLHDNHVLTGGGFDTPNLLWFMIPFGLGSIFFVAILIVIIKVFITVSRRLSDTDGDGLANDDKPATAEQKKLIQEGFRKIGVHHEVKKGLTQAEARETLREIDKQLKRK